MCSRGSTQGNVNDGLIGGIWAHFAPTDWATQWYWKPGSRGKVWNFLHGKGWRVT